MRWHPAASARHRPRQLPHLDAEGQRRELLEGAAKRPDLVVASFHFIDDRGFDVQNDTLGRLEVPIPIVLE